MPEYFDNKDPISAMSIVCASIAPIVAVVQKTIIGLFL
jgi:hypothetical protein